MTMYPPAANTPARNRARAGLRGRRGSAIILVIVSIVLMAILGATFVQVARFERVATGGEHIDIAIDSVLNEVAVVLARDLYNDRGDFFHPQGSEGDLGPLAGGGDEPYDYPFTNAAAPMGRPVVFVNGNSGTAQGGQYDDAWLASTTLRFNSTQWAHLSDLTGKLLDNGAGGLYNNRDLTTFGNSNPGEVASLAAMVSNLDLNDPAVANRLVDADGDGIGDSLWAYAPAAEIAGKRYVYAIRIVDLSSRININTAMAQTSNGGTLSAGDPQGDNPVELDASAFALIFSNSFSGSTGNMEADEVARTVEYRLNMAPVASPFRGYVRWGDADQQRRGYWLHGASLVDDAMLSHATSDPTDPIYDSAHPNYDAANTYGLDDLAELLHRGGLNNPSVFSKLENDMPLLLRRDDLAETRFDDASPLIGFNTVDAGDYLRFNPRLWVTTASGAMAIAPSAATAGTTLQDPDSNGDSVPERVLQADINGSNVLELLDQIRETLEVNGGVPVPAHLPTHAAMAAQLALNLTDMRDPDNRLRKQTVAGDEWWGMEALPFLSEAYIHREYLPPPPSMPDPVTGFYTLVYDTPTPANPNPDYAIEIRNPFNRPISLEHVYLFINGSNIDGSVGLAGGDLTSLGAGVPSELDVGESLVLYRQDPLSTADFPANVTGADYLVELPVGAIDWPTGVDGEPVFVELRAEEQTNANTSLDWGYSILQAEVAPDVITINDSPTDHDPILHPRPQVQISYQGVSQPNFAAGTGTGLDMLRLEPSDYQQLRLEPNVIPPPVPAYALGDPTKPAGGTFASSWDTGDQQWLFLDKQTSASDVQGRIPYVADILTVPIIGPNSPGTSPVSATLNGSSLGQVIAVPNPARLDDLMLEYRRNEPGSTFATIDPSLDPLRVPHGVLLLSRLTAHSPMVDGIDLDGDSFNENGGSPDVDEVFVPGKININTATREILVAALPYPTLDMRQLVADRIIAFRENDNTFLTTPGLSLTDARPAVNSRTGLGIAHMGELLEPIDSDIDDYLAANPGVGTLDTNINGQNPDWNNTQTGVNGPATNGSYPNEPTYGSTADYITGDREEDLMLAKWLNEVCGTRSDVFAVYLVVQGFPEGNFGAGPVESARVIAVFSRSNVRQVGDKAQLLAVRRVE
ncbi:MAG: hypothetical protein AAGA29_11680 [Planctomycetota bacterium]